MNTKYSIGDVLVITTYYDEVFASNVKSIKVSDEGIFYTLAQLEDKNKPIIVCENYQDDCFYNIAKKLGNINN